MHCMVEHISLNDPDDMQRVLHPLRFDLIVGLHCLSAAYDAVTRRRISPLITTFGVSLIPGADPGMCDISFGACIADGCARSACSKASLILKFSCIVWLLDHYLRYKRSIVYWCVLALWIG